MNRDEKAAVIDRIAGQLEAPGGLRGRLPRHHACSQVAELRASLREADATLRAS